MSLNLYRALPWAAGLSSGAWLAMILFVMFKGYQVPTQAYPIVIGWFVFSLLLVGVYVVLVGRLGPTEYDRRSTH